MCEFAVLRSDSMKAHKINKLPSFIQRVNRKFEYFFSDKF